MDFIIIGLEIFYSSPHALFCSHIMHEICDRDNEVYFRTQQDSSLLEGTEYRVVDTEDGQVASVTLTLDPDEEVRYVQVESYEYI